MNRLLLLPPPAGRRAYHFTAWTPIYMGTSPAILAVPVPPASLSGPWGTMGKRGRCPANAPMITRSKSLRNLCAMSCCATSPGNGPCRWTYTPIPSTWASCGRNGGGPGRANKPYLSTAIRWWKWAGHGPNVTPITK